MSRNDLVQAKSSRSLSLFVVLATDPALSKFPRYSTFRQKIWHKLGRILRVKGIPAPPRYSVGVFINERGVNAQQRELPKSYLQRGTKVIGTYG